MMSNDYDAMSGQSVKGGWPVVEVGGEKLSEPQRRTLIEQRDKAVEGLKMVEKCFEAARVEGLHERVNEQLDQEPGSLADLVARRLVIASGIARSTLAAIEGDAP